MNEQEPKCPRRRHAQIHLPDLDAEQAVTVARVLEKAIEAIWRAHGDEMAEFLGRVFPDSMPRPPDAVWSGSGGNDDDVCF
jgi:uncharacterized protein (DUF2384 family)